MTGDRPYRERLALDEALTELRRCAGSQFDPTVVELFCDELERGAGAPSAGDTQVSTPEQIDREQPLPALERT